MDDDAQVDDVDFRQSAQATLFAIEVNGWMAQQQVEAKDQTGNRVVPVVECIRSIVEVLRGQLLTKTIDKVGILLFGLQLPDLASLPLFEGVSAEANCNCLMLHDLESPKLAALKTLTSLLENEDERSKILVPSDETIAMSSILFYLNQVFTTKASNFKSRNLIIVTDNDNPHQSNPSSRAAAAIRAKDLYDLGVNTELIPFSKPNHKFDWTLFYDDVTFVLPEDNPQESSLRHMNLQHSSDILSLRRYISQSISSRFSRRLSSFSLTVELISGIKISAKAFLTVKRQELLSTCDVYVDNEQAHLVEKSASLVDEGRRPVSKDNVCTAFPLGDDTAVFTKLEIGNIRLFKDATLSIIGFKPEFSYPLWANLRPPICIYPTEEGVVGSTRLLTAIYLQIKARKVVGLGWFYSRRNASPCVVMITAGSQSYHGPESKAKLNSLFLIPLPFAEDIRPTVRDQCSNVSTALVNSMTVIIQQLQLAGSTYDPRKYSNPALTRFIDVLVALALNEDLPDLNVDSSLPRYRQISKRISSIAPLWLDELHRLIEGKNTDIAAAKKHKLSEVGDNRTKKRHA